MGASLQYDITEKINFYAGWSQAYRPVILKDIVPASVYEVTNKNLKDAYGSNAEIGFRGNWKSFIWDITAFNIKYNNRLGTIAQTDTTGNLYIFRTNIGNSETCGIELFIETNIYIKDKLNLSTFTSSSFMDARYKNAIIRSGNTNIDITGNKVESVPTWISRNGLNKIL